MDLIDRINAAHLELSRLHFAGEGFKATGLCFVAGELHARLAIADLLRRWAPRPARFHRANRKGERRIFPPLLPR